MIYFIKSSSLPFKIICFYFLIFFLILYNKTNSDMNIETDDTLNEIDQFNIEEFNSEIEKSIRGGEQAESELAKKGPKIVRKHSETSSIMTKIQNDSKYKTTSNCGRINPPFYSPERVFGPNLPNSQRKSAPQYSFGRRRESLTDINGCGRSPGPKYNVTEAVNYIKKRSPAFTIGIKTKIC